jgi:hypothetical protein
LIAVIKTAGGLELDTANLVQVAPSGQASLNPDAWMDRGTAQQNHLGWGAFFQLSQAKFNDGSDFSQRSAQNYIQSTSTASLSDMLSKLA